MVFRALTKCQRKKKEQRLSTKWMLETLASQKKQALYGSKFTSINFMLINSLVFYLPTDVAEQFELNTHGDTPRTWRAAKAFQTTTIWN